MTLRMALWGLSVAQNVVVARAVSPRDFGLYALALAVASLASRLKQVGSAEKLIRDPEAELRASLGAGLVIELAAGLAGLVLLVAGASVVRWDGADHRVPLVVALLGILLLQSAAELPAALFHRRLEFRALVLRRLGASLAAVLVTIGAAIGGLEIWSLVAGQIVGVVASAVVFWPGIRPRPSLRLEGAVRKYVAFGLPLWGLGVLYALAERGSVLVVSSTLGLSVLGYVHLAQALTSRLNQANDAASAAIYPALRSLASDSTALRDVLERTNRVFALGGVLLGVGLALFADDWVPWVFGPAWRPAIPFVSFYCLAWGFSAIGHPCHLVFQIRGDTRPLLVFGSLAFVGRFAAVVAGAVLLGELGLLAAVLGGAAINVITRTGMIRRMFADFSLLAPSARPVLTAAVAVAATRLLETVVPHSGLEAPLRVVVFAVAAVAGAIVLDRATLNDAVAQARGAMRGILARPSPGATS